MTILTNVQFWIHSLRDDDLAGQYLTAPQQSSSLLPTYTAMILTEEHPP